MYSTNHSRVEYYRQRRDQTFYGYDDDFEGFSREAKKASEEKEQKKFLSFISRKLTRKQKG